MMSQAGPISAQGSLDLENVFYVITVDGTAGTTNVDQYVLKNKNEHMLRWSTTIWVRAHFGNGSIDKNGDIYFSLENAAGSVCRLNASDGSVTTIVEISGAKAWHVYPGKDTMYVYRSSGYTISEYTKAGVFVRDITLHGGAGYTFQGGLFNIDRSRFHYETRDQYGSEGKGYIEVSEGLAKNTNIQGRAVHFKEPFGSGFLLCDSYYNKYVYDGSGTGIIVGLGYISGYYARGISSPDGSVMYSLDSRNSPDEATLRKSNSAGSLVQQTNPTLTTFSEVYAPVALGAGLLLFTGQQSPPNRTYYISCMDYTDNSQVLRMVFSKPTSGVAVYVLKIIKYAA